MKQTKIILKDLAFYARHGLTQEEAKLGQRFKVDIVAKFSSANKIKDSLLDCKESTIDYVSIYKVVKNIFENNRFNLIEACAESIGYALLDEFKKIEEIKVLVKKPAVPVDCICEYFAAEVTLCR